MVIIVADDPDCQVRRKAGKHLAILVLSHIPMLEPSDAQECKDFVAEALATRKLIRR